MGKIQVLDQVTIDKIAAGEVIERPASVIKELTENAIDAGATAVTVEIKEGGISLMRIADNGCGIAGEDVRAAFLRHSTSKIRSAEDLFHIASLGFRGEALSSIAAVSQVELITKTREEEFGTRYRIAGGKEEDIEETGAPEGTTFLIRQLFYNIPARKKFLKTAMTEASHVGDLMTRIALSHPEISFRFINNGQPKLHTSGNGSIRDVIYHVYGREAAANLLELDFEKNGIHVTGFLGKPVISRGNRNFENYFVSGRYIKSNIISRAVEDAYKDFSMQHKYPFVVLHIGLDGEHVDVNVHPSKMEVRFHNQQEVYNVLYEAVSTGLHAEELIPHITLDPVSGGIQAEKKAKGETSEKGGRPGKDERPEQDSRKQKILQKKAEEGLHTPEPEQSAEHDLDYFMDKMKKRVRSYHEQNSSAEVRGRSELYRPGIQADRIREAAVYSASHTEKSREGEDSVKEPEQLNLFENKLLEPAAVPEHKIIGQIFDTYWLVEYHDSLYIIDQHAAHERILYEKTLKGMKTREFTSQMISPPIVLELTMQERELLDTYMERFTGIGFEFEEFGQDSYAVRAVPDNLFSIAKKELLLEMLDQLSVDVSRNISADLIDERIASMSCKAAVKGNMRLSAAEVDTLIGELLTLDNPYHCPHGRPTIIAMSKKELEKKFKRIV